LHRWHILDREIQGHNLDSGGSRWQQSVVAIRYCVSERENGDSWYWFLERLKQMVVKEVPNVCVIHDRHKGILQAMNDIKEGSEERNRAAQWHDIHSRWCIRYMGANFHNQFKNKQLDELFKRLCSQNQ
jgi:hypothetical protein